MDVCVITKEKTDFLRNYERPNERGQKNRAYTYRRGTTAFKSETVRSLIVDESVTPHASAGGDAMDTT